MNAHIREVMIEIAREAKAIVLCDQCHNYDVRDDDADAEAQAYAKATNAWKDGQFAVLLVTCSTKPAARLVAALASSLRSIRRMDRAPLRANW